MVTNAVTSISSYHAHIYFDPDEVDQARVVAEGAREAFGVLVGRFHTTPVGPHPRGSCQLTIRTEQFGAVIPWLALNRDGLTVFTHPNTGDGLIDHSDHVIWLGPSETLRLEMFGRAPL